jgi:hypothetical protein
LLQRSLAKALADQPAFELVAPGGARPDRVVSARVVAANAPLESGSPAQIRVVAESRDAHSDQLLFRAVVEASGSAPPEQDPAARVERAVSLAADQIAARLARFQRLRGTVIEVSDDAAATVNRGSDDGLTVGTDLQIVREGQPIARLHLGRVGLVTASGKLTDVASGLRVRVNDEIRLASDLLPGTTAPLSGPAKKKHRDTWVFAAIGVVVVGTVVGLAASGGKHQDLEHGQIYVTAANSQIPADGVSSTTITASVRNAQGQPAKNGTEVEFGTTLGLIAPGRAAVQNGLAKTTLISAPVPGTATISASVGALKATTRVVFTPTSGSGGAAHLTVRADPPAIPADGVSTSIVTALVSDAHHNTVPDGTMVTFHTSLGVIGPGSVPTQAGIALATLHSVTKPGEARVTVQVGDLTRRVTVSFVAVTPAHLSVTANPTSIPADGVSTSTITALVSDENNRTVPDGTLVTFATSLGVLGPATVKTQNGIAAATLHSSTTVGTAMVTVEVGSLSGEVPVTFTTPVP